MFEQFENRRTCSMVWIFWKFYGVLKSESQREVSSLKLLKRYISLVRLLLPGDEQLFAEGEIGKTPSGGSISTYKDLCSLATDMNQPDLVYKFISLANHNMMWNSRKVNKLPQP